jgi:hypothetical protein
MSPLTRRLPFIWIVNGFVKKASTVTYKYCKDANKYVQLNKKNSYLLFIFWKTVQGMYPSDNHAYDSCRTGSLIWKMSDNIWEAINREISTARLHSKTSLLKEVQISKCHKQVVNHLLRPQNEIITLSFKCTARMIKISAISKEQTYNASFQCILQKSGKNV